MLRSRQLGESAAPMPSNNACKTRHPPVDQQRASRGDGQFLGGRGRAASWGLPGCEPIVPTEAHASRTTRTGWGASGSPSSVSHDEQRPRSDAAPPTCAARRCIGEFQEAHETRFPAPFRAPQREAVCCNWLPGLSGRPACPPGYRDKNATDSPDPDAFDEPGRQCLAPAEVDQAIAPCKTDTLPRAVQTSAQRDAQLNSVIRGPDDICGRPGVYQTAPYSGVDTMRAAPECLPILRQQ